MAGSAIRVTPETLKQMSSTADGWRASVESCKTKIYDEVNTLSQSWNGEAQQAWFSKIKGFEDDFLRLAALLSKYSQYLSSTAETYSRAEAQIVSESGKLSIGN